jgi:hypothetical protein
MYGHFFFYLCIIAAVVMPFVLVDAIKQIKNEKDTLFHKIILGACCGIIMWTILMMMREGLELF